MGSRSFRIEWYLNSFMKLQFYELLHKYLLLIFNVGQRLWKKSYENHQYFDPYGHPPLGKLPTVYAYTNNIPNQRSYLALSFTVTTRKITMGLKRISNRIHFFYSFDFTICQILNILKIFLWIPSWKFFKSDIISYWPQSSSIRPGC